MLALLALALFPVAAQAENSAGTVYKIEGEVPSVEGGAPPKESLKKSPLNQGHSSGNHKEAEGSAAETTETGEPEMESESESEGEGKKHGAGSSSGGGNNNPPNSGGEGGNKPSKGGGKPGNGIGESKNVGGGTQPSKPVSSTSSSSSPVVPILIAVVVLAAISIGVVLYRQRKSGQGPSDRGSVSSSAS